uniref:DUF1643 domain-containing protein n=1 Tax=Staphylococcus aureus TaxID=1280 RepID=R4X5B4_STAAU|nr:hypothetical protein [Staphylococcus aureus]
MNTIKSTIHTEAIFSDDEQHRYLLKKTWDKNKPACTVITMYPHLDGVLSLDLTTVLILNQLANSEQYGAVYLVNLFSNIKTPENLKHIKEPYDKHTDIHLMKAISESDTVISSLWRLCEATSCYRTCITSDGNVKVSQKESQKAH